MKLSYLRQNIIEGDIEASLEVIADFHDWFRIRLLIVAEMQRAIDEQVRIYRNLEKTLGLD
jgi:hypothetical protein